MRDWAIMWSLLWQVAMGTVWNWGGNWRRGHKGGGRGYVLEWEPCHYTIPFLASCHVTILSSVLHQLNSWVKSKTTHWWARGLPGKIFSFTFPKPPNIHTLTCRMKCNPFWRIEGRIGLFGVNLLQQLCISEIALCQYRWWLLDQIRQTFLAVFWSKRYIGLHFGWTCLLLS